MKKAKMQSALHKYFNRVGQKKSQIPHHECPQFIVKYTHTDEDIFLVYGVPMDFQTYGLAKNFWKPIKSQVSKLYSTCIGFLCLQGSRDQGTLPLAFTLSQTPLLFTSLSSFIQGDPLSLAITLILISPCWYQDSILSELSSYVLPVYSNSNECNRSGGYLRVGYKFTNICVLLSSEIVFNACVKRNMGHIKAACSPTCHLYSSLITSLTSLLSRPPDTTNLIYLFILFYFLICIYLSIS